MSLINQMLQDLDSRRATHGVGVNLPNEVRPLPPSRSSRLPLWLGALVLLTAGGGGVWYFWPGITSALPGQSPLAAPAPVPASEPAPVMAAPPAVPEVASHTTPADTPAAVASLTDDQQDVPVALPPAPALPESPAPPVQAAPAVESAPVDTPAVAAHKEPLLKKSEHLGLPANKVEAEGQPPAAKGAEVSAPPLPAKLREVAPAGGKAESPPRIERTEAGAAQGDTAEGAYRQALLKANQGRAQDAIELLRGGLQRDAAHLPARQLLIGLLLEAGEMEAAMQALQAGLQVQPGQISWAMGLARLQVDRGALADAWQTLNHTLPAASGRADYQGFIAHVLLRLGRGQEAETHYQLAVRLAPGDGRWWLGLGLAQESTGQLNEARESFLHARQAGNLPPELQALVAQKLK